ncbi:bifunctional phosphoribosyl-AMP cyclohydrolase/phosphoribosyl-ATP diphosphatase HisIE [Flammeovirgaceae bacterium SG7u.111]|nr:bifunctional phosphoribosyl-AMP cyclohydrolase/phosphoribosyl-ATP diphosphatase HisIE [Flammeovirgaceae bacterium SG7u.132]WPO35950.1 bifunctional phosphoribosyl-AMP cyclohydrolase/phosphoribosyl-ATP diphosphatase HisIE [Flammeovirgaceae bacterium SG7u.111]
MMMEIDFEKGDGLVPAVVQDSVTNKVLMVGYMNAEALEKTKAEGKTTFFSRSKQRLWTKGETSGNFLFAEEVLVDCDNDTVLVKAKPVGPACHTGADTCFKEDNEGRGAYLNYIASVIKSRRQEGSDKSYTSSLFDKGINKIAQKVGEEAVELVIEAKDDDKDLFLNESADLLFHFLVLLEAKGYTLDEVIGILEGRHKK